VGGNGSGGLFEEEVAIKDELTAIDWLRQKVRVRPNAHRRTQALWMRSVGLLSAEVSQGLSLEDSDRELLARPGHKSLARAD